LNITLGDIAAHVPDTDDLTGFVVVVESPDNQRLRYSSRWVIEGSRPVSSVVKRLNGYSPVMSYKVVIDKDGISYPQFYCDVCREPIETLEEGNTIFSSEIPGNTSHVHKLCSMKTKPHGYDNWHDLSNDVVWLLKRYGWLTKEGGVTPKFEKAVDKATKFEGF
jgi:hypothetical protein